MATRIFAKVVNVTSGERGKCDVTMLESMVSLHSHVTRLGVLDIGSNTVHMLIVDAAPGAVRNREASTKALFD